MKHQSYKASALSGRDLNGIGLDGLILKKLIASSSGGGAIHAGVWAYWSAAQRLAIFNKP